MSLTLKNGTACRTLGASDTWSSIATSKGVLLSAAIPYLRSQPCNQGISSPVGTRQPKSRFQPRRLMIASAGDGCKSLLGQVEVGPRKEFGNRNVLRGLHRARSSFGSRRRQAPQKTLGESGIDAGYPRKARFE